MSIRKYVDALARNEKERVALRSNEKAIICVNKEPEVHVYEGIQALAYGAGVELQESEKAYFFNYDGVLFFQENEKEMERILNETL
ncbi:MAG: hypothetical protein KHY46_12720 [Clostridiales bacterium]|nr:hypothetical protein [Clostridiales bacterium]